MEGCEFWLEQLSARLDGELTSEEERELERHLVQCPDCRALSEQLEALSAGLQDLEEIPAPEGFAQGVMERIAGEKKVIPLFRRPQVRALAGLAAGAAVCLWLLLALHRNRRASLAYITQGLTGAALLLCAAAPVLHWLMPIRSLNLQPASLKALLAGYVTALFDAVWPFAAVVAVMTALCGGLYALSGRK